MTTTVTTPQGWMVEVADWDKVRILVDELFPTTSLTPPAEEPVPADAFRAEQASVAIYNGTMTTDLAQQTATLLQDKGYVVAGYSSADRFDHTQTLIVVYRDRPLTVAALALELGVDPEAVIYQDDVTEAVDVAVILGQDYLERLAGR